MPGTVGLLLTIFVRGYKHINSLMTDDVNSVPLSLYNVNVSPKTIGLYFLVDSSKKIVALI